MRNDFIKYYDVAVAGGGVAGVAAALAAARWGKRVVLLEKTVLWGGLATTGLIYIYLPLCDGNGTQVTFGLSEELLLTSLKYGPGQIPEGWCKRQDAREEQRYRVVFSPASMVIAMDELLEAAQVDLWLDTRAIDVRAEGDRLEHLVVTNKSGIGQIKAERYVDATGDADLAFLSGAQCPEADNALAFWGLEHIPSQETFNLSPGLQMHCIGNSVDPAFVNPGISGGMVSGFVLEGRRRYRERLTQAYTEGQSRHDRFPVTLPAMAQLRHTRRISGRATLRQGMEWRGAEDSVGMVADWRKPGKVWEIPYACLLPDSLSNVIAAGRCISSEGDAWEVTRVIQAAALTGEAAGTAAALSIEQDTSFSALPVDLLQGALRESKIKIHFDDIY